jgi:beta-lactamase class D
MIQRFSVFVLIVFCAFACSPNNVKTDPNIEKILDSANVKGCFALMENGSGQFTIINLSQYKDSAFAPLNTYFAIPTLVALDKGYINHTASTWVSPDSTVYYQALMEKIGRVSLLKTMDSLHYGKGIVSNNLTNFWNDGSLKITADEQLGLIKKLYFNQLPFQKRSHEIYKQMILKEDNANYKLSYILGTNANDPVQWILGYVEENKHPYFFVMHFNGSKSGNNTVALLKTILTQQGFLKGLR